MKNTKADMKKAICEPLFLFPEATSPSAKSAKPFAKEISRKYQ